MQIRIDAHQHFWQLDRGDYDWLRSDCERLAPLYRDFMPEDLAPSLIRHGIRQTVLVQAAPTAAEIQFLLDLADKHPFIGGVVGWVDLAGPDVEARIERLATHPKLKGVRPMLQDLPNPKWISESPQIDALHILHKRGLRLDALIRPDQLDALRQSVMRWEGLPVAVNHAAKPKLQDGWNATWAQLWRRDLRAIAELPQVMCKFSGLLTEAGALAHGSVAAGITAVRPVWDALLDIFGPERLMWGSDWPVGLLAADFEHWLQVSAALIGELSPGEQNLIWAGNAERFYDLSINHPIQPASAAVIPKNP